MPDPRMGRDVRPVLAVSPGGMRLQGGSRGALRALRLDSIRVRTLGRVPAASPAIPWPAGALRRKLPRWWLLSFFVAVDVLAQERAYLAHHDAQARQSKYAAGDQHERETVREQRLGDSEAPRDTSQ